MRPRLFDGDEYRTLVTLAVLTIIALMLPGCFFVAATGPTPTIAPVGTPTPTPSPTPTPVATVSPTPDLCAFKAVRVSFAGGSPAQVPSIPLGGEPVRLDATPLGDSGPIPDGCNLTRSVVWSVITPTTCQIVGGGFNPFLRALRIGGCTLTATVERVVSDPFSVEVR